MYFFNRSHGRQIVSHLATLNGVSSRPAISWPWFTLFAGRTCSALFRPRGPFPYPLTMLELSIDCEERVQCCVVIFCTARRQQCECRTRKNARQAHGCCRKSYVKHPPNTSLLAG